MLPHGVSGCTAVGGDRGQEPFAVTKLELTAPMTAFFMRVNAFNRPIALP